MTIEIPKDMRGCNNCMKAIPIYKNGEIIARLCERDMEYITKREILAEDMSGWKACSGWMSRND